MQSTCPPLWPSQRAKLRWSALALTLTLLLSACGGGSSISPVAGGTSSAPSASLPNVVSMTPVSATSGVATTFTVNGSNLPANAVVSLAGGSCAAPSNVTSSSFTVVCTPGPVGQGWAMATINNSAVNGYWIGQATLTIGNGPSQGTIPQNVTSISPQSAQSGVPTTFTITGSSLPLTAVVSLPGGTCAAPTNVSSTGFTVVCTPGPVGLGWSVATVSSAAVDGYWIGQATLTITGAATTGVGAPTVSSMSPASAQAGVPTTFVVSGTNLPLTAVVTLAGGSCATPSNVTATGFTVVCTPGQVGVGTTSATIYNAAVNGYWIGQATLAITSAPTTSTSTVAPAPSVTGMSPQSPRIGVATTFTVTGSNLPLTATVSLAGGSCATPTNATSQGFTVVCIPGTVGTAVATVNNSAPVAGGYWIGTATLTVIP